MKVPARNVYRLSRELKQSPTWSSLVMEVAKITQAFSRLPMDARTVLIVNGGIEALLCAVVLREKGMQPIICNGHADRRKLAANLNFSVFSPEEITAQVERTKQHYSCIMECSGAEKAVRECIRWVSVSGTIVRCDAESDKENIGDDLLRKNPKISIEDSQGCTHSAFREAMDMALALSQKYPPGALGVKKFSISDYGTGIESMRNKTICKALFFLTDPRARRFLASPAAPLLSPSNTPSGLEIPHLFL